MTTVHQPVRILHFVTIMNMGGIETLLMTLYRNIDRSKVQFDFVVHRQEEGVFDEEIKSLGGKIFRLPPQRLHSVLKYTRELNVFFQAHPEYKIIHSHLNANSFLPLIYAKKNRVDIRIAHSHTRSIPQRGLYKFLKNIQRKFINQIATHYFACSKDAAFWLFGKHNSDVFILKNSIDTARFTFSETSRQYYRKLYDLEECNVYGHVGGFSYPKNHSFLLDVFKEISKKDDSARLLLVGEGSLRQQIERKITELGMKKIIILPGSQQDIPGFLSAMDKFLFPSLFEGLPNAAIEAQCTGLPLFISDTIPDEIKIREDVCVLSLSDSPEIWAQTIMNYPLVSNSNRRKAFLDINKAGYDAADNASMMKDIYLSMINQSAIFIK